MSLNLSRKRRRWVVQVLRSSESAKLRTLDLRAQIVYTLGLLAADKSGTFDHSTVTAASADPATVQVAQALLQSAGYAGGESHGRP